MTPRYRIFKLYKYTYFIFNSHRYWFKIKYILLNYNFYIYRLSARSIQKYLITVVINSCDLFLALIVMMDTTRDIHVCVIVLTLTLSPDFVAGLKSLEQSVNQRLEEKTEIVNRLEEDIRQSTDCYETRRTSVSKKALSIIKDIDSIEVNDLESLPNNLIQWYFLIQF